MATRVALKAEGGLRLTRPTFASHTAQIQGFPPDVKHDNVTDRQVAQMIGNSMSVNVLERLLSRLLVAVNLMAGPPPPDRWA